MSRERLERSARSIYRFRGRGRSKKQIYTIKRKYTVFILCMLLLCLLPIASLAVYIFFGRSLSGLLTAAVPELGPVIRSLRSIISLDAVLKMGEAVGLCSFLIAWIYASLDKKESGFSYSELLLELYPGYHLFVLVHLAAFLMCIWMAKVGRLEAAVLALVVVLAESFLQWNTLKNLILFSDNRMRVASDRWNRLINENSQKTNDELLITIYSIADALIIDVSSSYENMLRLFSRAVAKYIDNCLRPSDKEAQYEQILWRISRIWERLLSGKSQIERELLLTGVLKRGAPNLDQSRVLCTGYLLWSYNHLIRQGITNEDALTQLGKEVAALAKRHFICSDDFYRIPFYMEAAFTLLAWMHFMCGNIRLDSDLFKLAPSEQPTPADKELLRGFARTVFDEASCGRHLDLALRQMF